MQLQLHFHSFPLPQTKKLLSFPSLYLEAHFYFGIRQFFTVLLLFLNIYSLVVKAKPVLVDQAIREMDFVPSAFVRDTAGLVAETVDTVQESAEWVILASVE